LAPIQGKEVAGVSEIMVGKVIDYFGHIEVAAIDLSGKLKVGDKIHILGHSTNLELIVESMQIDRAPIAQAKSGDSVGILVPDRVRIGDSVYLFTD
jgi:putative protease